MKPSDIEPVIGEMVREWTDGHADVIVAGLSGAYKGWLEPPRRTVPCKLGAENGVSRLPTTQQDLSVMVLPGLRQTSPALDLMRAEEIRLLGFATNFPDFAGVVCVTGDHSKWATLGNGYLLKFETVMTEELFNVITSATILRHSTAEGWDEGAFLDGVALGADAPDRLTSKIFSVHAADIVAGSRVGEGRSRLLGIMIGAEISPRLPFAQPVGLIGDGHMMTCYDLAIEALGRRTIRMSSQDAITTGLIAAKSSGGKAAA